jgi:hypothetical protein
LGWRLDGSQCWFERGGEERKSHDYFCWESYPGRPAHNLICKLSLSIYCVRKNSEPESGRDPVFGRKIGKRGTRKIVRSGRKVENQKERRRSGE